MARCLCVCGRLDRLRMCKMGLVVSIPFSETKGVCQLPLAREQECQVF